ncbi:transmembrane protein 64-like [Ptychodera flava]|uniref:transmembrane protein 64-like n=1 Tax=Ptychodera flava TaxID=63121 RepID=UPI00396A79F2
MNRADFVLFPIHFHDFLIGQGPLCDEEDTEMDNSYTRGFPKPKLSKTWMQTAFLSAGLLLAGCGVIYLTKGYIMILLLWLQKLSIIEGILVFALLFFLVSLPMTWGYIVFNVAAGYLYGFFLGMFTVMLGVFIGTLLAHFVCRHFFSQWVVKKIQNESLRALMRVVEGKNGFKVIMLARFTPIPFGVQNGLFAITSVKTTRYLLASSLGLLPTQILNTYMGTTLRSMEDVLDQQSFSGYFMFILQLVISIVLTWYVVKKARSELNKTVSAYEQEMQERERTVLAEPRNLDELEKMDSLNLLGSLQSIPNGKHKGKKFFQGHRRSQSDTVPLLAYENEEDDGL